MQRFRRFGASFGTHLAGLVKLCDPERVEICGTSAIESWKELDVRFVLPKTLGTTLALSSVVLAAEAHAAGIYRVTEYSLGGAVGGPDEMQDQWTNKGYTSTGQNLTPGVVAVDESAGFPLGTIFKDPDTGYCYIAADRHGNGNPRVIDVYRPPSQYGSTPGFMSLDVWKQGAGRSSVGATPEAIRAQLEECGEVPEGESAKDWLAGKSSGNGNYIAHDEKARGGKSKDACRQSATMDSKAECDPTHEKVAISKVVEKVVSDVGTRSVEAKGRQEAAAALAEGPQNMKEPYSAALRAAGHGENVLTTAGQTNLLESMGQFERARLHHQMRRKLAREIEREKQEVQSATADESDLASSGQEEGSTYALKSRTVRKFEMNSAGTVKGQQCNVQTDPGCRMAKMKRRDGFEQKKKHVSGLLDGLKRDVQKEQDSSEKEAQQGALASLGKAIQQLQGAAQAKKQKRELASTLESMQGEPSTPEQE
jgi:hypothetical protein